MEEGFVDLMALCEQKIRTLGVNSKLSYVFVFSFRLESRLP